MTILNKILAASHTHKFNKIFAIFSLVLFWAYQRGETQSINTKIGDVQLPAPNAAALGKYGDIPVSLHTGVPNISIPLHTIKEGSLSLPISLNYHASGIKVGELASWVGLGWSLNAGGMITRTIMGIPDENIRGYYNIGVGLQNGLDEVEKLELANGARDGEPDVFTFNVGNISGKFFFDKDKKCQFLPKQDLKVIVDPSFINFTIISSDGTSYIFEGMLERTYTVNTPKDITTWYLTKIESLDKKSIINFSYKPTRYGYYQLGTKSYTWRSGGISGQTQEGLRITGNDVIENIVEGYNLSTITTAKEIIEFVSNTDREDLVSGYGTGKRLDAINITEGGTCKKFILSYDYFRDPSTPYNPSIGTSHYKRLQLTSLSEQTCDGSIQNPPHNFIYMGDKTTDNKIILPNRLSKEIDHWGFYNEAGVNSTPNNQVNVPAGTQLNAGTSTVTVGIANRESNTSSMLKGVLNKIIYPTGGYSQFQYEGNTARESQLNIVSKIRFSNCNSPNSGTCCQSLETPSPNSISFSSAEITSAQFTLTLEDIALYGATACQMGNFPITVKIEAISVANGQVSGSYQTSIYTSNQRSLTTDPINISQLGIVANTSYNLKLYVSNGKAEANIFYRASASVVKTVGGLRVKEIRSSDGVDVNKDIVKTYNYTERDGDAITTSGLLVNSPRYSYYFYLSGNLYSYPIAVASAESIVPLNSYNGYHILYTRVEESLSKPDLNGAFGKTVYTFKFVNINPPASHQYPYPPSAYRAELGQPISQQAYDKVNNKVKTSNIYYNNTYSDYGIAYKVYAEPLDYNSTPPFSLMNYTSLFTAYSLSSGYSLVMSQEEIVDGVNSLSQYEYNPQLNLNPICKKVVSSDGKEYKTKYYYAHNLPNNHPNYGVSNESIQQQLIKRNVVSVPLKIEEYIGNTLISGSWLKYKYFEFPILEGNIGWADRAIFYPFESYKINKDGTSNLKETVEEYLYGLPKKVTQAGYGVSQIYSWDNYKRLSNKTYGGLSWSFNYYGISNLVSQVTDENGLIKKFGYDGLQRLTMGYDRMKPDGTDIQANSHTAYQYSTPSGTDLNTYSKVRTATRYKDMPNTSKPVTEWQIVDGLGRLVGVFDSSNQRMKSYITYDNLGRQDRVYQPYLSAGGPTLPPAYVTPFKYNVYEASPLSRVLKSYSEDNTFVETQYGTNIANDVRIFTVGSGAGSATASGYYAANTLYKTTVINENGKTTELYKDKLGRVILTRKFSGTEKIETYNVYDDYGQLVAVLPPGSVSTTGAITHSLIFQYKFDVQNRLIEKKVPGAEPVKFFYDNRDLVTLTQDGNTKAISSTRYLGTQYDEMGRVLKTGWVTTSSPETFATSGFPIPDDANKLTETQYYLNKSWVKHQGYKLLDPANPNSTNFIWSYIERRAGLEYTGNPVWTGKQHLLNGLVNRPVLDADVYGVDWSVSAYNGLQKPYVTYRYMYGNASAGTQVRTFQGFTYDDAGRMTDMKYDYALNGAGVNASTTFTLTNMVYNHKDQLTEKNIGYKATSNTALQSIDYSYNLRGWLTSINSVNLNIQQSQSILTPNSIGTGTLQNLAITPWVYQSLNNVIVPFKQGIEEELPPPPVSDNNADLFSENIYYNTADSKFQATPQYNGNIQAVAWQVAGRDAQGYGFTYDDLDRLTNAKYFDLPTNKTTGTTFSTDYKYDESQTYDVRGNIVTLKRNGLNVGSWTSNGYTAATYGMIDNLKYVYDSVNLNNRLLRVHDYSLLGKGFKSVKLDNSTNTTQQYTYDANGNLKSDLNKGITNIDYNFLNLPQIITFTGGRSIQFIYDASGAKLRKIVNNNNVIETTDYVNGIEYKNNTLQRVAHTEGAIIRNENGAYQHEFVLRDHLGNVRVSFRDGTNLGEATWRYSSSVGYMVYMDPNEGNTSYNDGIITASDIRQINNYYPFGLNMEGNWNGAEGTNKYQYNEKEWNDDFGLGWNDYGARFYDPAVARWWNKDPLSEKFKYQSPYSYVGNMPTKMIDIKGMFQFDPQTLELLKTKYPRAYSFLIEKQELAKWGDRVADVIVQNTSYYQAKMRQNKGKSIQGDAASALRDKDQNLSVDDVKKAFGASGGPFIKFVHSPQGMTTANGFNHGNDGKRYSTPIEINIKTLDAIENAKDPETRKAAFLNLISTIIHEYTEDFAEDRQDFGNGEFGAYVVQETLFEGERPGIYDDFGNCDMNCEAAKRFFKKLDDNIEKHKKREEKINSTGKL